MAVADQQMKPDSAYGEKGCLDFGKVQIKPGDGQDATAPSSGAYDDKTEYPPIRVVVLIMFALYIAMFLVALVHFPLIFPD